MAGPVPPPNAASLGRFLCGTVNDFVAEVGRAYKRATENKQEAELMARKVREGEIWGIWGACPGVQPQEGTWQRRASHGGARTLGVLRTLGCPIQRTVPRGNLGCPSIWGEPVGTPQCAMLNEKLDSLVRELTEEAQAAVVPEGMPQAGPADAKELEKGGFNPSPVPRIFKSKEQLMLRANSLKKALRQIIEQAEKGEGAARGRRGVRASVSPTASSARQQRCGVPEEHQSFSGAFLRCWGRSQMQWDEEQLLGCGAGALGSLPGSVFAPSCGRAEQADPSLPCQHSPQQEGQLGGAQQGGEAL